MTTSSSPDEQDIAAQAEAIEAALLGADPATADAPPDDDAETTAEAEKAESSPAEPAEVGDSDYESASDILQDEDLLTDDELLERQARPESPFDRPGRWFVVHTQSGYEKKVKQNLEARIQSMNVEDAVSATAG